MARSSVDLPMPEGPWRTRHSPEPTASSMRSKTGRRRPPWLCSVKLLARPRMRNRSSLIARRSLHDRGDEKLRVGVLRIIEHLIGESCLDHLAAAHHHEAVSEEARDAEIVRDDDRSKAEF